MYALLKTSMNIMETEAFDISGFRHHELLWIILFEGEVSHFDKALFAAWRQISGKFSLVSTNLK